MAVARQRLRITLAGQPANEALQQSVQLVVGRRARLKEARHAIAASPVHLVQLQAVKVDVEVGG